MDVQLSVYLRQWCEKLYQVFTVYTLRGKNGKTVGNPRSDKADPDTVLKVLYPFFMVVTTAQAAAFAVQIKTEKCV